MGIEKYGVRTKSKAPGEKTAASKAICPKCGAGMLKDTNIAKCSKCGTEPFEETPNGKKAKE